MSLHPRRLLPSLLERMQHRSIVVLTGARQTGKTTLVRDLLPRSGTRPTAYFSLDDPDERLRLAADPVRRLDLPERLVILDEIQKQPELIDAVKLLVDQEPDRRFLLLGSSQILLLQQVRESLAGRATLLELWPLAMSERASGDVAPVTFLDRIWQDGAAAIEQMANEPLPAAAARKCRSWMEEQIRWGGYPGLEPLPDTQRTIWLRDFRRTYLERDLADLGRVADLDSFALAQNLLADRTGQLLSYSEVARDLGVAVNTVKRYIRFLEISYQVILLRPLQLTTTTRLIKSPKLFWTDAGLARTLTGRTSLNDGHILETTILNELVRWCSWQDDPPALYFYRTRAGQEVDIILHSRDQVLAIEVKAGSRTHPRTARQLGNLLQSLRGSDVDQTNRIAIIANQGREIEQLAPMVWAIPVWLLLGPVEAADW